MGGVKTNGPTVIDGYNLTASAAFSLRSIVGTSTVGGELDMSKASPILARANEIRKMEEVRFITETHIVKADADLFHEQLSWDSRLKNKVVPPRPGGSRGGRQRGAPIDDS